MMYRKVSENDVLKCCPFVVQTAHTLQFFISSHEIDSVVCSILLSLICVIELVAKCKNTIDGDAAKWFVSH